MDLDTELTRENFERATETEVLQREPEPEPKKAPKKGKKSQKGRGKAKRTELSSDSEPDFNPETEDPDFQFPEGDENIDQPGTSSGIRTRARSKSSKRKQQ